MSDIKSFDRANLRIIDARVLELLKPLGEELELNFQITGGTFAPTNYRPKLEIALVNADGSVATKEAEDFKAMAKLYGFEASDLDKEVVINRKRVIIKGLKPRSRKYPILGQVVGGKMFKYPANTVLRALGKKTTASMDDDYGNDY